MRRIAAAVAAALIAAISLAVVGGLLPGQSGGRTDPSAVAASPSTLDAPLLRLVEAYDLGGLAAAGEVAQQMAFRLRGDLVRVVVEARPGQGEAEAAAIRFPGSRVEKVRGDLVQVLVPVASLRALGASPAAELVRLPYLNFPLVTGQGVSLINADDWHAAGVTGSGVKVAVLDLGFAGYDDLLGSELPDSVVTHSCRSDDDITGDGQVHGAGVAEIVHEVAPDAQLYLVNFDTDVEFAECVDWIIAQGVDVINHSVGWLGSGPGDGTGVINDVVSDAVAQGVFWSNSAGNQAQRHWSGNWQDADSDNWLEFSGSDEGNRISIGSGSSATVFLWWDDPWGASCNNYDLYLKRTNGTTAASSKGIQSCSQYPIEALSYGVSGDYDIAIRRVSADGTANFHLFTFGQNLEHQVAAGSLMQPADNPDALTVGAVWWATPNTIEYFSSQGPTTDGRRKPNVAGPDGVSNVTAATFYGGSFFGTSASSPHAAGAAALVLDANPSWTPAQVLSFLEARAVDLGAAGPDNVFGAGRLYLGEPGTPTVTPTATDTPTPTATPTPTCVDRLGDTSCDDPVNDPDDDGCATSEEQAGAPAPKPGSTGAYDPDAWYDFYDVPVPARPDAVGANGTRNRTVTIQDVLAVLFYVGTEDNQGPNSNGVDYDTIKGVDLDGDTTNDIPPPLHDIEEGAKYDRSPSPGLNPPWDAGPPDGVVAIQDVLVALAQVGLDCSGAP